MCLAIPFVPLAMAQPAPDALAKEIESLKSAVSAAQMSGDNAWMLASCALVLLMTGPGLALFYGGLVRR
jgi:Amt family ammonium transporter